uniref:Integrase catalytic domain-containing protein n=1 Tax=Tanacetum cinerariifolium TaxID=118510 RepID=A0A6L2KIR7_TANCI|nr:hypothetical protein [Tanacetum cinerariifolium]
MPYKPDLVFNDTSNASKTVPNVVNVKSSSHKPNKDLSKTLRPDALIIEDWTSDSENISEIEFVPKQKEPSFVQTFKYVKTPRASVKTVEHPKQTENLKTDNQKSKGHKNSSNRKACFVCKSLNYLIKDCDYYKKQMVQKPIWNNVMRVNHHNYARLSHPYSNKNVVPTAVLTRTCLVSLNVARPVSTAVPQTTVNSPRPVKHVVHKAYSPIRRPINHKPTTKTSNFNQKITTVKVNKGNPHHALKDKGVIYSGCSRHMTENISYLSDFEEFNGGCVAFGGNPKGDTECVVLSFDFKLPNENHVLLRVPRENNMYNVDLKNVVPSGDLTCLFAKAALDESNLWHRRLGHINFKTMNKLVKGNLVRGLPSKIFENNHTCVACKKGKQHRASCKSKPVSSISHSLQRLHIDLFEPTFVKSLNKKSYCLVVTDDYSRFSWVFFLATKDETSTILKTFITGIENQINHKVKIIRCDNGTKFKNHDLNQFCRMKRIKIEFSVARTPQQNGVAERKNRTPIEEAKTMLADSLLPIPFWAEVVNTACYVQNRVLVTKPYNKTPYELLLDGKADEEFLVGYSVNSKAFRVFNSRARIVQETLHTNFLENQPNITGSGPKWLFDIDTLTQSMNYQPVVTENQPNHNAGIKENLNAGKVRKETVSAQQYVLLPLWSTGSKDPQNTDDAATFNVKENKSEVHVSPSSSDKLKKHDEKVKRADKGKSPVDLSIGVRDLRDEFEEFSFNSTNRVNAASAPVTAARLNLTNNTNNPSNYPDDPDMPALEDIVYSDDENVGAVSLIWKQIYLSSNKEYGKDGKRTRSMIGSLMYLTSSRPDIMFAVCACVRFQVTLKVSHLHAVKRIFRHFVTAVSYKLLMFGLTKDAAVKLMLLVASLTFADMHNMVAFLSMSDASAGFDQIMDFLNAQVIQYALMVNPTIYVSCIKHLWATTLIKKANDVVKLQALIDRKKVVVTEDVICQDLRLDDADGVECLPNEKIVAELARMGYEKPPPNLTFYKAFFSAQWKFFIHTLVQCVSAKRTAWNEFSCSMASASICLATGRKFNFSKYIFDSIVRKVDSLSKFLMYPRFLQVMINNQLDDLSSHTTKYTSPPLTQKVFANMRKIGKGFLEWRLLCLHQCWYNLRLQKKKLMLKYLLLLPPPSPTNEPSSPPQDPITTHPQAQPTTPQATPPQEQPTDNSESFMTLLNTLMENYMETQVDLGAELQGRKDNDSVVATKDVSAVEPTVFDDEEVTITMAQTLIKMKAEKARILDEQMAKRLHDKEVEQVAAKEKQEQNDLEKAKGLQQQYDDKQENIDWDSIAEQIQEKHLDNIRKYRSLKRKPISIAQARKNMIIYLKNMAGYKMEHFRGMTYDKIRPIFEREYNKVQTLFKPNKDVEEPQKKRVAEETLLQESFKKLKAVEVSGSESTRDTPTNDLKEMSEEDVKNMLEIILVSEFKVEALQVKHPLIDWEIHSEGSRSYGKIIRVGGITEAYQSFEDMLKGFDREDLDALWRLVKDKFKKDYPLSNVVMIMMLSAKLQVEEDSDMARDLVMKIFIEANKLKSRSLDTSSNFSLILAAVNMSLTDINASLTEHNLHQQCKFFSRGNSSTQQLEHFFTSSGKITLAVGTILHYQWQNNSSGGNSAVGMIFTNSEKILH